MSKTINLGKVIPEIGDNGNWWANGKDLGVAAKGDTGEKGDTGAQGEKGETGDAGKDAYITDDDTLKEKLEPYLTETLESADSQMKSYLAENVYITPEIYGAVGDGETDDTVAFRNMLKAARADNKPIKLGYKKTYIVEAGTSLGTNSVLDGNYSTILIDKLDLDRQGYGGNFFLDGSYKERIDLFDWKNLTIDITAPQVTTDSATKMSLFHFYDVGIFRLSNCHIIYEGSELNAFHLFKFEGRATIYIDDCILENYQAIAKDGSIIWFQSKDFDYEGHVARIRNTDMYTDCWDEITSHYLGASHDIIYDNCKFVKKLRNTYYAQSDLSESTFDGYLFTFIYQSSIITDEEAENIYHRVIFNKCDIKLSVDDDFSGTLVPYAVGNWFTNVNQVKFIDCNIDYSDIQQLATLSNVALTYDSAIDYQRKVLIEHENCKIKISNVSSYGLFPSNCGNISFKGCDITVEKYLINNKWVQSKFIANHRIDFTDNLIRISNGSDYVVKLNKLNKETIVLKNNKIITDNSSAVLVSETSADSGQSVSTHLISDAVYSLYNKSNILNDVLYGAETDVVINAMDNNIANCAIDGVTDDYAAVTKILDYVNSTNVPVTVVFPNTGSAMLLSDTIYIKRSDVTLKIYCDVKFTKSTFSEDESMVVIKVGVFTRTPLDNVHIIGGGNNTIDGNGSAVGLTQTTNSQVNDGIVIWFKNARNSSIENINVTNGLVSGIKIYNSKNIIVDGCDISNTCIDNGLEVMGLPILESDWTFDELDDRCINNVIVRNCTAHGNEDLGFTASVCHGVTFENCVSYENGNADGYNAGGGFSAECLGFTSYFEVDSLDFDYEITFRNCTALNNNNYAFYTDADGVTIDNCTINTTVQNDGTTSSGRNTRGGNGIWAGTSGRLDIYNTKFKNTAAWAVCVNTASTAVITIKGAIIDSCTKGIYVPYVDKLYITDTIINNVTGGNAFYLLNGTVKNYEELKNIKMFNSGAPYIGGTAFIDADDIYYTTLSGTNVAINVGAITSGSIKGLKIYKGENTSWLTAVYIFATCGSDVVVETPMTDADTTLTDKRESSS